MAERQRNDKPLWRKIGGGSMRLKNDYRVKPNEYFRAYENEIPKGAKHLVELLEKGDTTNKSQANVETVKGAFTLKHKGFGRYDVISTEGTAMNDKALPHSEAEQLKDELNRNQ